MVAPSMPTWPKLDSPHSLVWRRVTAVAIGAGLLAASQPSLAAPAKDAAPEAEVIDTEARAMQAYREGQDAYETGDYGEALQLFLEAQSLYPSPDFHYNIGKCHEALESYEQAVISYKAYLRASQATYGELPEDAANVDNKIERLERQIESDRLAAEAAANKPPEVIIQTVPNKAPPGRALIITGAVLGGVGLGVAIAGAAVFGPQAGQLSSELEQVYTGNPERLTLAEARQIDADGRAAGLNQVMMISIGSAVALTGVALLAVGLVKKQRGAGPTITPTAGPQGAGLIIQGRF